MARRKLPTLALLLLTIASKLLSSVASLSTTIDSNHLTNLLSDLIAGNEASALYSGSIGAVTIFGCRDVDSRVKLWRQLSRHCFLPSSLFDVRDTIAIRSRLAELAGETGREHQDLPSNVHKQLLVLELGCPGLEDLVAAAGREQLFSAPFKWLVVGAWGEARPLLAGSPAYPDSELLVWDSGPGGQLANVYRTGPGAYLRSEPRGSWEPSGLVVRERNQASRRRRDLDGTHLKSCLVVLSSYMITHPDTINHLNDYHERHIDSITKCNYPWALHLVGMLNATVSFESAGTWGYQSPNGSWGGMIGMLQRGEIDFGGTSSFLLNERLKIIQYISLSTPTESKFIFRRPPLSSTSNLFRLPFRGAVWLVIFGLVILLVCLLYPAMRIEWARWGEKEHLEDPLPLEPRLPNLSDDLLVVLGAVSQQGSWYEPRALSTRIIILMALLAAVTLNAAYTANIVALLTSTTSSIKSLSDLLNSHLTLAVHDNVFARYYFKAFRDPVRRAIFEKIEPPGSKKNNWMTIEDGVERMRRGYFAFHVELGCAYKIVQETFEEDEKCGFEEIDFFNVFDPHFIVKKRSPYLELLRIGAIRLHETGLRGWELDRLYTKKPVCSSASRFLSVGLSECYGAFLTLLFGLLLGLAVFFAELLVLQLRRRSRDGSSSSSSSDRNSACSVAASSASSGPLVGER